MLVLYIALGVALGIGIAALIYRYRHHLVRALKALVKYAAVLAVIGLAIYATRDFPDWKRWLTWLMLALVFMLGHMLYDEWKSGRITSRP